jgi:uncharacterized membrane protein YkoI
MKERSMRRRLSLQVLLIAFACAALGPVLPVRADDAHDERESAEEVYAGAKSGVIMPLTKILEKVRKIHPGEVVETKFEHRGAALVYEIYFLDASGRRVEIYVDARTGEVLKSEGDD